MKEIIKLLIDRVVEGYEWYFLPKTESLWMINPDTKHWLLEYENSGDLWYFWPRWSDFFKYVDMESSEYQQYIQSYVEDVLQNGVRNTFKFHGGKRQTVEDVLQNGVRNTTSRVFPSCKFVEDVLQNGVRNTASRLSLKNMRVEDVLQNGEKL